MPALHSGMSREHIRSLLGTKVKWPKNERALAWAESLAEGRTLIFQVDDPEAQTFVGHHVRDLFLDCPN